ncbi:hypothetical protein PN498_18875 [Oscillatoria sp. CS-180]|uniref:hypothetical protein n=1 Tax=Oscillatoria sp. CS-180 TaxID=3021720 RepID=UPI002330C55B|nr:hypothetical protein [Oscillatoria sp. CS-180]MDB9528066.1 hypothetical protein [Oscillatoria sp. CS-180]
MVSFRSSQFRALLAGLIIADAMSHQQLRCLVPLFEEQSIDLGSSSMSSNTAIVSDRWCHRIVDQLSSFSSANTNKLISPVECQTLQQLPPTDNPLESLLIGIPKVLAELDPTMTLAHHDSAEGAIALAFYQGMMALLDRDLKRVEQLEASITTTATTTTEPLTQMVALAFEHVLSADGDFILSVRQSLYSASPLPGLPILAGILSSCWTGLSGLPLAAYAELYVTSSSLRGWLQPRWRLTEAATLEAWATGLWQQWSGSLTSTSFSSFGVAVQPVSISSPVKSG